MHHGILAGKQDGGWTEDSVDACTNLVGNSYNLASESNKPLNHRDDCLRKINLTFKRGFLVLKLAETFVVIHLPLDSVLDLKPQMGQEDRSHVTFRGLRFTRNEAKIQS